MDLAESIVPKSDQLNAEDLLTGPRTVTIVDVTRGTAEQPVDIVTAEFGPGRPYKPSKSMRRILVAAWGAEASAYVGRRITIYRDPDITFGKDRVGGIRISHMSNLSKRLEISLTVTRGKRAPFVVDPLPDAPPAPAPITSEQVAEFERRIADAVTVEHMDALVAKLKAFDLGSHRKSLLAAWSDRKAAIENAPTPEPAPEQATLADAEPVTDEQIQDLAQAREQTYGTTAKAQQDWAAWVNETTGRTVDADRNLTRDEADDLLALLAAKDGA